MPDIDRDRLANGPRRRARPLRPRAPALTRAVRAGPRLARQRRADDVDGQVGRRAPGLRGVRPRGADRGRRRPHVRRLRARRHRRDGGPLARADGQGHRAPRRRRGRHHRHAPDRGRGVGGGGARTPLRPAAVELRADRDRREPLGASPVPRDRRAPVRPGLQPLLPRLGRRVVRHTRQRRAPALTARERRPRRRPDDHHARRGVQRPRRREGPARRRTGRVRPHRAGAHEHRDRPA